MNLKGVLFFYDWCYFQDVVSLLNRAKKYCFHEIWKWVIFKAQTLYPIGEEDIQRIFESKMHSPPCFANSVSQISNNTGSLQHHREVRNGLLQEDIKGAAEKQTGVRVSFQIQTVRISRWIPSGELPGRWRRCVALHFLAWAKFSVRERRAPSTTYNTLTALLSSVMLNANDISAMANM